MPYGGGGNIPQVAIQPSAAPIGLNIYPAAGQRLQGNDLQQVAEALVPFNQGLLAFGNMAVDKTNERAAALGSMVDFNGASDGLDGMTPEARGEALNKRFKQAIAESGGSDAANPYFLVAAQQNFGRTLGLQYRNQIWAMKERVTDPDNPLPYTQASAEAASGVIGNALEGNFYGLAGFREVAAKADAEMMATFAEERTRRIEAKGALTMSEALTEAVSSGDMETANASLAAYQRVSTDPKRNRETFLDTSRNILRTAATAEDLGDRLDRIGDLKYGNQSVRDNADLWGTVVLEHEAASNRMMAKAEQQERLLSLARSKAKQDLYASDFIRKVSYHVANGAEEIAGKSIPDFAREFVDTLGQEKGWTEGTKNEMFMAAVELSQDIAARRASIGNLTSQDALGNIYKSIKSGEITDPAQVWDRARDVRPEDAVRAIEYLEKQQGPAGSAISETIQTLSAQNAGVIAAQMNLNGLLPFEGNSVTPRGALESNKHALGIAASLDAIGGSFIRNEIPDGSGKFYRDYANPQDAAYATRRLLFEKNNELLKKAVDQSDAAAASGKISMDGQYVKQGEDFTAKTWASQREMANLVQGLSSGSVDMSKVPEAVTNTWRGTVKTLAEGYDVGIGAMDAKEIERSVAEAAYRSMTVGGGPVVTNDSRIRGSVMGAAAFAGGLLVEGIRGPLGGGSLARIGPAVEAAYDHYATKKDLNAIKADYGAIKRVNGLTLDEVLLDVDSNGFPVLGTTLPRDRKELLQAAYSVLVIQSTDELRDQAKVDAVLGKFGLGPTERESFIKAQTILLDIRRRGFSEFNTSAWFGGVGQAGLDAAKSEYQRTLERAQQKASTER